MEGIENEKQGRGTIINAEDEHVGEIARAEDLSPTAGPKEPAEQEVLLEERCPSVDSEEAAAAGVAPTPPTRLCEQEKLRDQLQKLVSHKLSQGGELDQAGIAALEALSKMPPPPGSSSSSIPPPGRSTRSSSGGHRERRHLPPGVESLPKFNGGNPSVLTDTLARFNALVVSALPGSTAEQVNRALLRDVINVLEGAALKFYNDLMNGRVEWEPVPPGVEGGAEQPAGGREWSPPTLWVQVCDSFHDNFLPAEGIARTARALLSLKQVPGESVPSLAGRHLSLSHHLSRLVVTNGNQTAFWEAMSIALFEQGLRPDLKRAQDAGPPCATFQESVDRADRIAAAAAAAVSRVLNGKDGVGAAGAAGASYSAGAPINNSSAGGADIGLREKDRYANHPGTAPAGLQPQPTVTPAARYHHPLAAAVASPPVAVSDMDISGLGEPSSSSSANGNAFEPAAPRTGDGLVFVKCEVGADDYEPAVAKANNIGGITTAAAATKTPVKLSRSSSSSGRDGPSISSNKRSIMHAYYEDEAQAGLVPPTSQLGGGVGNPLDGGGSAASNHFGGGGFGEEARVLASREPSQYSGSRRGKEKGRDSQLRGDQSRSPSSRRKPHKKKASLNAKRRREWADPNTGGGGGSRDQHPHLEETAADRPPCSLPQCQSINRQFHCANDCFYHMVNGEQNRLRYEARHNKPKRPFRMQPEPMGYNGYYGDDHQNQGPRYDHGFAGLH